MEISAFTKKNIEEYEKMEYNSIKDLHDYIDKNEDSEMYLMDKHGNEQYFSDGLFGLLGILRVDDLDDTVDIKYINDEIAFTLNNNRYTLGTL